MKSKITDPELLVKLTTAAYKSRLEMDVEKLIHPETPEEGKQNFFLNTEHKFAGEKTGEPLLVVGLTPVWKDYIKEELKAKNPNFATGTCYLSGLGKSTLNLEISKGKAKPAAIEKSFKKNAVLKKYTLQFTILAEEEDQLPDEQTLFAQAKPTDKSGKELVDAIKKEMANFKQIPVGEKQDRLESLDKIVSFIDQWQEKHPTPAGADVAVATQLQKLEDDLRAQKTLLVQKSDTKAAYAEAVSEFKDIQNMDWNNMTQKEVEVAIEECQQVLRAVDKFEKETDPQDLDPSNSKDGDTIGRILQIRQIKEKTNVLLAKATLKKQNKDFLSPSVLMSPASFLEEAGINLKDDSDFASLVKELEAIQTQTNSKGLTLDGQIAAANKTMRSNEDFTAISQAIETKLERLKGLGAQAQKWLKDVGNAPSLIKALSKDAKERNERKKAAIQKLLENIKAEMSNTQMQKALAAKSVSKVGAHMIAANNAKGQIDPVANGFKKLKSENPNLSNEELVDLYAGTGNDAATRRQNCLDVLFLESKGGKPSKQEKTDMLLNNFDVSIQTALQHNQDARTNIAFAFRNNTVFSALSAELFNEIDEDMAAETLENLEIIAVHENKLLEIDPDKEPDLAKREENTQVLLKVFKKMLSQFAGKQAANNVPTDIRNFCRAMHQKCTTQNIPVEQILDLIASTIVLRYINPLIIQMQNRYAGKANARNFIILSKALQNYVNGIVVNEKEPFMAAFTPLIRDFQTPFKLYIKTILGICAPNEVQEAETADAKIAREGDISQKGRYVLAYPATYLGKVLANPNSSAYEVLNNFAEKEFSTENLEYMQLHKLNQHKNLKTVKTFILPDSEKAVNIKADSFSKVLTEFIKPTPLKQVTDQQILDFLASNQADACFENIEKDVQGNLSDTWSRLIVHNSLSKKEVADKFYSLI